MLLTHLEIIGFKSFGKRTKLEFHPGVTGVVGPNGCGKSNIVDAIRWVMGEQKGSVLRSEKMEQVIFNGAENRKSLGMADVALTMLNDNGLLPSEYSEVTVSRRLYRNGDSEYLLNRKKCRLKDIVDLFLDTGLGADSYGIIEPSLINRILTENPEERRILFEEAAGIAKYKLRVRTAERRLETVNENLERITDILSEVEKNVQKLKRQYNQAKKFEILRAKLEELGTLVLAIERRELIFRLELANAEHSQIHSRLSEYESTFRSLETELEQLTVRLSQSDLQLQETRSAWENLAAQVSSAENHRLLLEEKQRSWQSEKARLLESGERSRQQSVYLEQRLQTQNASLADLEKSASTAEYQTKRTREEYTVAENTLKSASEETASLEKTADTLHNHIDRLEREIAQRQFKIASHFERQRSLKLELAQIEKRLADTASRRLSISTAQEQHEKSLRQIDQLLDTLEKQSIEAKQRLKNLENLLSEKKIAAQSLKSELQFLQSLIDSGAGLSQGAVYLLENKTPGVIDNLGNLLEVPPQFAAALEAALGEAAHYLAVENPQQAENALDLLRRENKGKAVLAALNTGFTQINRPEPQLPGALGSAARLIDCDTRFRPLFDALLGNTLVVKSWKEARQIQSQNLWDGLLVTLDGEALGKFFLSGGKSEERFPALGRKKRADDASARRTQIESEIASLQKQIETAAFELAQTEKSLKSRQIERSSAAAKIAALTADAAALNAEQNALQNRARQIQNETEKLTAEASAADSEMSAFTAEIKTLKDEYSQKYALLTEKKRYLQDLKISADAIKDELHRAELQMSARQGELNQLKAEIALAASRLREIAEENSRRAAALDDLDRKLAETVLDIENAAASAHKAAAEKARWKEKLNIIQSQQNEIKQQRVQFDKQLKEQSGLIESLRGEMGTLDVTIAELKLKIAAKEDAASEKFGVDLEAVEIPAEFDKEKIAADSAKLKNRLDSIGPVNLLALEEYGSQNQRLQFLQNEHSDIVHSKEELLDTISKTNMEARIRFKNVFNQVAEYFTLLFHDLFEGGFGQISLASGDILDAPIEIQANPGGKKLTNMDQLSGGEKTLTALALIFALYQVKPSPFCILDEVDAPLDDANVERFIKLIKRFTPQTQFILITHNKITMEACDFLFGVTMEEDGLSKIVSVDLNTTYQMAESP